MQSTKCIVYLVNGVSTQKFYNICRLDNNKKRLQHGLWHSMLIWWTGFILQVFEFITNSVQLSRMSGTHIKSRNEWNVQMHSEIQSYNHLQLKNDESSIKHSLKGSINCLKVNNLTSLSLTKHRIPPSQLYQPLLPSDWTVPEPCPWGQWLIWNLGRTLHISFPTHHTLLSLVESPSCTGH